MSKELDTFIAQNKREYAEQFRRVIRSIKIEPMSEVVIDLHPEQAKEYKRIARLLDIATKSTWDCEDHSRKSVCSLLPGQAEDVGTALRDKADKGLLVLGSLSRTPGQTQHVDKWTLRSHR